MTSLSLAAVAMSDISALRPTNEAEERSKFLAALETGTSYEPQLKYVDAARAEKARASCDQHLSDEFAAAAASVLSGIIDDHGSEEQYQQNVWGRALEASEVDAMCDAYLNTNNLLGRVQFVWSPETLVTMFSGSTIKLVTRPGYYRELRLASLLDHEVGTHFIRTHNHKVVYSKQSERKAWSERATGWLIATEEGLATLNTHRLYSDKRFWIPALHYHAALLAAKLPFSELWAELSHFLGNDVERLWTTCLRVKRGLEDTGKPGGYYKDQSNFAGAMRLLQQRQTIDWTLLHSVRVSLEDFGRATPAAKRALDERKDVLLPAFVRDGAAYREALEAMAVANGL